MYSLTKYYQNTDDVTANYFFKVDLLMRGRNVLEKKEAGLNGGKLLRDGWYQLVKLNIKLKLYKGQRKNDNYQQEDLLKEGIPRLDVDVL